MWRRGLLVLLGLLPVLLTLGVILTFGVNLPFWDEWVHLQAVVSYEQGRLSFGELIAQYNESRKVFPRLAIIVLGHFSGGDQRAQMLLSWLLACGTLWGVHVLAKRSGLPRYFTPVAAVLLMSIVQWQNWLWGIQFVCFTPLAALVLILVLCRQTSGRPGVLMVCCALLCTVAMYSYANGMLLFVLAAVALKSNPRVRWHDHLLPLGLWTAAMVGAYFTGYARPAWTPTLTDTLADPLRFGGYFLALVGGGLVPKELSAEAGLPTVVIPIVLGIVTLVLLGVGGLASWRQDRARALPWLLIAAYSLVSLAAAAGGRSPFGVENALLSRYTTFSLPLVVATIGLLFVAGRGQTAQVASLAAVGLTFAASVGVLPRIGEVSERQRVGRVMLHFCLTAPQATQTTFVADFPQHPLIVPTAVELSRSGFWSTPISADGDLRPMLTDHPVRADAIVVAVPGPGGVLRVERVLSRAEADMSKLPPGARLFAVQGSDLAASPLPSSLP
jgi:hypothetical protein